MTDDLCIESLRTVSYCLPLKSPWVTARGALAERRGWLLILRAQGGLVGYGDCAPMPVAGTETLAQAGKCLREAGRISPDASESSLASLLGAAHCPATHNAIETALLDVRAQANGLPLHRFLSRESASAVKVNANVGVLDGSVVERCRDAVVAGYKVLKIKIGIDNIDREIKEILRIHDKLHEYTSLRLDANRSWSMDDAMNIVHALRHLPLESLEEPLKEPGRESLQALQDMVAWPIAIDESVSQWSIAELLEDPPASRIICKPAVMGGVSKTLALARALEEQGTETVVTTTLESAAGTWACVHLAAALNNNRCHGLATSDWFVRNTGNAPQVKNGRIQIAQTPGLGFTPDAEYSQER